MKNCKINLDKKLEEMDKESFIISQFKNKIIGDDGAFIDNFVYSKDIFAQDIHFKKEWLNYKQIAIKSMLVNISDAIVMNAIPKYALIGLALPKNISFMEIKELIKGFKEICKKWKIKIIGGDTVSGDKICISITIISKTSKPIFRKGLKKGQMLGYTGSLGKSLKQLKTLQNNGKIKKDSKFIKPKLRAEFFYKAAPYFSCAMDISDGLNKDLSRLCKINNLTIKWKNKPSSKELNSGEEYEILFGFKKKHKFKILKIAKQTKTKINLIGIAKRGKFICKSKEHHF